MLSLHLALPCKGHLEQMFFMFRYLKKHHNAEMVFDPRLPSIDQSEFEQQDWTTSEAGLTLQDELHAPTDRARFCHASLC